MSRTVLFSTGLILSLTAVPRAADAQRVSADIVLRGGPIAGVVRIGRPPSYYGRYVEVIRPRARPSRVIVLRREPARVQIIRWQGHRHDGRYCRGGHFSRVGVFYDGRHDRFYDGYRPGLEEVEVYEHDGVLYRDWDRDDYRNEVHRRDGRGYRDH